MGENNPKNARLARLQERRAAIQARMDAHVIGGGPVAKSLALIERMRAELHVPSWWLLTRRKKRLDRKIHALGGS
mgnify:CR=1 FL=1